MAGVTVLGENVYQTKSPEWSIISFRDDAKAADGSLKSDKGFARVMVASDSLEKQQDGNYVWNISDKMLKFNSVRVDYRQPDNGSRFSYSREMLPLSYVIEHLQADFAQKYPDTKGTDVKSQPESGQERPKPQYKEGSVLIKYLYNVPDKMITPSKQNEGLAVVKVPDSSSKAGFGCLVLPKENLYQSKHVDGSVRAGCMNAKLGPVAMASGKELRVFYSVQGQDGNWHRCDMSVADFAEKFKDVFKPAMPGRIRKEQSVPTMTEPAQASADGTHAEKNVSARPLPAVAETLEPVATAKESASVADVKVGAEKSQSGASDVKQKDVPVSAIPMADIDEFTVMPF